jgi:hypothetical protein
MHSMHGRVADVQRARRLAEALAQSASCTAAAGAVNQRPGRPLSWIPMSVPLRAIRQTRLEPATPPAAIDAALGGRHREVQEEVVVAGDEPRGLLTTDVRERREQRAHEEVARGLAAHV